MGSSHYVPPPINTFQPGPAPLEQRLAYIFLRVLTGADFLYHGITHVFTGDGLPGFVQVLLDTMQGSHLPSRLVVGAAYAIPCVELAVGALLLIGFGVRYALMGAYLLLLVLLFGICMQRNWSLAGLQLLYALVIGFLLLGRGRFDRTWPELFRRNAR